MSAFWIPEEAIGAQVDMEEESPWGYQQGNFAAKGLLGKSTIDGLHSRRLLAVGDSAAGLAYGDKKAEIYTGSLITSYKIKSKLATFEPEIFLNANKNYDRNWREIGGGNFNLRYMNYDDFFLRSRLSIKISPPLTTENTNKFSPHLRVGWLADWNTNNSDVPTTRAPTPTEAPMHHSSDFAVCERQDSTIAEKVSNLRCERWSFNADSASPGAAN